MGENDPNDNHIATSCHANHGAKEEGPYDLLVHGQYVDVVLVLLGRRRVRRRQGGGEVDVVRDVVHGTGALFGRVQGHQQRGDRRGGHTQPLGRCGWGGAARRAARAGKGCVQGRRLGGGIVQEGLERGTVHDRLVDIARADGGNGGGCGEGGGEP